MGFIFNTISIMSAAPGPVPFSLSCRIFPAPKNKPKARIVISVKTEEEAENMTHRIKEFADSQWVGGYFRSTSRLVIQQLQQRNANARMARTRPVGQQLDGSLQRNGRRQEA